MLVLFILISFFWESVFISFLSLDICICCLRNKLDFLDFGDKHLWSLGFKWGKYFFILVWVNILFNLRFLVETFLLSFCWIFDLLNWIRLFFMLFTKFLNEENCLFNFSLSSLLFFEINSSFLKFITFLILFWVWVFLIKEFPPKTLLFLIELILLNKALVFFPL